MLDKPEVVPFRLTRNLATFFSPFGVEGVFLASFTAAAQAGPPPLPPSPRSSAGRLCRSPLPVAAAATTCI